MANDPTDPTGMFKRELVYLIPWIEYTIDNVVPIQKSVVMSMCVADSEISSAYDIQKEREDTDGFLGDDSGNDSTAPASDETPTAQDEMDNILGKFMFENGEFITDNKIDITDMSIKDIVNNILEDIINNSRQEPVDWDDNKINKDRKDYGNDLDDWSPYIEDYIIDPRPPSDDN